MDKLNFFLSRNHFRSVIMMICLLSVLIILMDRDIIPSFVKLIIFGLSLLMSFFFIPFQLVFDNNDQYRQVGIVSKILLGISCAYIALLAVAASESILTAGSILIICNSIFLISLLFNKSNAQKNALISFLILNFILIGVTTMLR